MNFKEETTEIINNHTISWGFYTLIEDGIPSKRFILKKNHTKEELEEFLDSMDFEYDKGYGLQEIDGIIVFDDGSWITREEYDGSEWWKNHQIPKYEDYIKE